MILFNLSGYITNKLERTGYPDDHIFQRGYWRLTVFCHQRFVIALPFAKLPFF